MLVKGATEICHDVMPPESCYDINVAMAMAGKTYTFTSQPTSG